MLICDKMETGRKIHKAVSGSIKDKQELKFFLSVAGVVLMDNGGVLSG